MSQTARDLARRLATGKVSTQVLAATVVATAAARAEAINREGLRAQIEYLLETYGPSEIENIALASPADGEQ